MYSTVQQIALYKEEETEGDNQGIALEAQQAYSVMRPIVKMQLPLKWDDSDMQNLHKLEFHININNIKWCSNMMIDF